MFFGVFLYLDCRLFILFVFFLNWQGSICCKGLSYTNSSLRLLLCKLKTGCEFQTLCAWKQNHTNDDDDQWVGPALNFSLTTNHPSNFQSLLPSFRAGYAKFSLTNCFYNVERATLNLYFFSDLLLFSQIMG